MSRFFIERPIFAWVIAIILMLGGALSLLSLPIAQYPPIAPPTISVTAEYPGASAETAQSTVGQVIEQQLSGLDHLLYFSSQSGKDGSVQITLSFAQGTDPDIAQVQVQNKLQLAMPRLPEAVQLEGVTVAKATKNFLMIVGFISTDGRMNSFDLSDFIASDIEDPISRTRGVGGYELFGSEYAMRIWLDPARLYKYGLTPTDVSAAVQSQNVQLSSGELGGLPSVRGQELNATIIGPSYLQTPKDFGNILLKVSPSGARVLLRDVAKVEIAAEQYSPTAQYNGQPASAIAVNLAAGANALDTVTAVRATISSLQSTFPAGVEAIYPYDTSPFVRLSVEEVIKTLLIAIVLVFLIMFLFLQNIRATLIPTVAVPVVLLATCGVLAVAGYSINCLTLFGMVLAIGLLVDDAIVVVENVERVMAEDKVSPREAALRSMDQISGALVGIALVLTAVLLPLAFFSGSTGVIYRQFSVTIVSAMILSVVLALVFTPALCATLLKPGAGGKTRRGPFGLFNRGFDRGQRSYGRGVTGLLRHRALALIVFVLVVAAMVSLYGRIPLSFLPNEDQGVLFVQVSEPPGATSIRTQAALDKVRTYFLTKETGTVEGIFTVNGLSFAGNGQNAGLCFVRLKPWAQRPGPANSVQAVAARAQAYFFTIKDALVFAFAPPAVLELGNATGFDFELMDNAGLGHVALQAAVSQLLGLAAKDRIFAGVRANGLSDEPQYKIVIDREKASAYGLSIADVNATMSTAWGSGYIGDFIDRGRVKRVFLEGAPNSRMLPDDLTSWYVRNSNSDMVPFSAFARGQWTYGPPQLNRYDGVPATEILGQPAPGISTGQAMDEMERLAALLPPGIGYSWTGLSYEERASGSQAIYAYGLAMVVTFLCLAALYESWAVPVAVLLVVPLGIIGAVMATFFRGLENDIYFQVGLLVTIGLSAKNAILIVEFAKLNYDAGMEAMEAAIAAAKDRLRPILMTSLAFILGVLPLALSTGAGSGSENAIGTVVVGGMVSATLLAIFLVPVFFVVVVKMFRVKRQERRQRPAAAAAAGRCRRSHGSGPVSRAVAAAMAVFLGLAGCTLDPTYQRPALPVAAQYPSAGAAYQSDRAHQPATPPTTPAALIGWRQVFTDPQLQALIALSLQNNRNLRIAILNIAGSQAQFVAQRANLFPLIDATTTGTLEGYPSVNAEPLSAPPASSNGIHTTTYTYGANLGFTAFELDVFGGIRSKTRSQLQLYLSEIETRRSTQISLVAEVASDYITLLADQEQLTIAQQTLDAQTRSYAITNAMFGQGTTTLLSLREAETTVDTAKASVAQYTRQVAQDENALTLVVGAPISAADLPAGRDLVQQDIMADLPAGLPSSLLTQRPDIMAAEHTLLSANALIGAARAAFFPSITLTASGGVASNSLSQLFTPGGETWLFEPTITLPIFTWEQNEANLDYAKVEKRIDIASYEQTVQTAFREVADGLAARGTYLDQLGAQQALVDAYRDAYRIADLRFRAGADGYLTTLDTQQSLFSSEQTLVSLKAAQLQNLVTLYKALGGGWYADTPPVPPSVPRG